ncbi:4Fe-4S dicluster domain-containing protein [Desulfovibrio sp. UCD-KL4C]|uniref:4Fe-4S dicluster domain-containing protein n=1 Tax=Desulfovibrio sp. UCD-KL4C TaxID=2578120 RepID=UPI0025C17739|nr:4Fe-4S dicluster domain-containing protein [Desulfovibrio sp. UCD-KL4C]
MKEYIIQFNPELCIQCHGCETACKAWRDLPYGIQFRRVLNLWYGSYPLVKSKSLSLSCLHCTNPECVEACPVEAISKNVENGRVLVDATLCIGCKACAKACPFGVPQFGEDKIMQKCDLCVDQPMVTSQPPCVATCPGNALTMTKIIPAKKNIYEADILEKLVHSSQKQKTF